MINSLSIVHAQNSNPIKETLGVDKLLVQVDQSLDKGNFETSIELLNQAKEVYAKAGFWSEVISCEIRQAKISDNFESWSVKKKHSDRALHLAEKYLPKGDVLIAAAYRQKAESFMWIENLDSAKYYLNKAVPILKSNKEWEEYGWTEILLAVNHLNNYSLDSCEKHLDLVVDLLGNETLEEAVFEELQNTVFDLKGVSYEFQGDYNRAISNIKEALEVNLSAQNKSKLDSGFISNQFNSLGALYLSKADYSRARDNFLQVIQFDQTALSNPKLLNNIGNQYFAQSEYGKAISYFEKSKTVSTQILENNSDETTSSNDLTESLNNLCSCYRALAKYDQALEYCRRAEEESMGYKNFITWATMGHIFIDKHQTKEALNYLNRAKRDVIAHGVDFKDNILMKAKIYQLLGEAEFQNQNHEQALSHLQMALVTNNTSFKDSLNFDNNPSLGGVYEPIYFLESIRTKAKVQASVSDEDSDLLSAINSFRLAVQWIDSLKASFVLESTQVDWSSEFKSIYEDAINVCFKLYERTGELKYVDLAFNYSEKSKSSVLLEQLRSKKGKYQAGIPDSIIQRGKDLQQNIAFYEKLLSSALEKNETEKSNLYQNYLSQYTLELADLEEKLENEYPNFYKLKYTSEQLSIVQTQDNLLGNGSVLLEYFIGDKSAFVFVIAKNTIKMLRIDASQMMKSKVDSFLADLQGVDSFRQNAKPAIQQFNRNSFALYSEVLTKPVVKILDNVNHLIIVPDGILNSVPFEALTDSKMETSTVDFADLPFLIYKYDVQYSYSAQLLFENKKRHTNLSGNLKCMGFAPSYTSNQSNNAKGNFDQLRNDQGNLEGTSYEILQISKYIKGEYFFGEMASEEKFKSESKNFGLLHLAMHGMIDLENSNLNHLKFSDQGVSGDEDHLLFQYEIANMDLNAQMAVLSACETGVGKYEEGEGVFSLARGFMNAGVPSVVMSLWRVSDASTSRIMPVFYEKLSSHQSKVSALRQAKLSYLTASNLSMRHPFYWSAFVVVGEGGALKSNAFNYNYLVFGVLILLMLLFMIKSKN